MRLALMWTVLFTLASGCSLVNDPSDLQGGDAGGTPDTSVVDTGAMDAMDAGPRGLTSEEYCSRYAKIMCDASGPCCDLPPRFVDCERVLAQECLPIFEFGTLSGLEYDGVQAALAINNLESLAADCDTDVANWAVDEFFTPLVGQKEPFAPCAPNDDSAVAFIQAAFSCDRRTNEDAICQRNGDGAWTCQERKAAGACYVGTQCTSSRCERTLGYPLNPGVCGLGLAVGERCDPGRPDQCASLICRPVSTSRSQCMERTKEAIYCRNG